MLVFLFLKMGEVGRFLLQSTLKESQNKENVLCIELENMFGLRIFLAHIQRNEKGNLWNVF
jgi:hypothetical protein